MAKIYALYGTPSELSTLYNTRFLVFVVISLTDFYFSNRIAWSLTLLYFDLRLLSLLCRLNICLQNPMPEYSFLLQWPIIAASSSPEACSYNPIVSITCTNHNDGQAKNPVHPRNRRTDNPRCQADQIARRHKRCRDFQLRAAFRIRLVKRVRGHHGLLHDRRGRRASVGRRERQVCEWQASENRGKVCNEDPARLGQVHEVHGEVLSGKWATIHQKVESLSFFPP